MCRKDQGIIKDKGKEKKKKDKAYRLQPTYILDKIRMLNLH